MARVYQIPSNKDHPTKLSRVTSDSVVGDLPIRTAQDIFIVAPTAASIIQDSSTSETSVDMVLSWVDQSAGEDSYEVEYQINAGGWVTAPSSPAAINAESHSFTITVADGDTVYGRVRATDGATAVTNWATSTGVVIETLPNAPSAISSTQTAATEAGATLQVNWTDNSSVEVRFKLEYEINGSGTWVHASYPVANAVTDSIGIGGLTEDDVIKTRIRAENGSSLSAYDTEATGTTIALQPAAPSVPTLTQIDADESTVTVRAGWTDNSDNEITFRIEYRINGGSWVHATGSPVAPNITQLDFTVTVNESDTIEQRVRAQNVYSSAYVTSGVVVAALAPAVPTANSIVQNSSTDTTINVTVSWTDNSANETAFDVEYKVDAGAWTTATGSPTAANATSLAFDVPCSENNVINARVRSVNAQGESSYDEVPATINAALQPIAPTPSSLIQDSDNFDSIVVTLSWIDNSDNEDNFRVEYQINAGGWVFESNPAANSTSRQFTVPSVANGDTVKAQVRSENSEGDSIYDSFESVVASIPIPTAPTGCTLVDDGNGTTMTASWTDNSDNEQDFRIQAKKNGGAFANIFDHIPNAEAFVFNAFDEVGAEDGDTVTVRVKARNPTGDSAWSESSAVAYTHIPAAPSGAVISYVSGSNVSLNFTDNSGDETQFRVESQLNTAGWVFQENLVANDTSQLITVSGYDNATDDVQLRVRAENAEGESSYALSNTILGTA